MQGTRGRGLVTVQGSGAEVWRQGRRSGPEVWRQGKATGTRWCGVLGSEVLQWSNATSQIGVQIDNRFSACVKYLSCDVAAYLGSYFHLLIPLACHVVQVFSKLQVGRLPKLEELFRGLEHAIPDLRSIAQELRAIPQQA